MLLKGSFRIEAQSQFLEHRIQAEEQELEAPREATRSSLGSWKLLGERLACAPGSCARGSRVEDLIKMML